jgi:hypothetical protein
MGGIVYVSLIVFKRLGHVYPSASTAPVECSTFDQECTLRLKKMFVCSHDCVVYSGEILLEKSKNANR